MHSDRVWLCDLLYPDVGQGDPYTSRLPLTIGPILRLPQYMQKRGLDCKEIRILMSMLVNKDFLNPASDWLAAQPPANQKPCYAIHVD